MKWKDCCQKWSEDIKPRQIRKGRFFEEHACPKCNEKIRIYFECSVIEDSMTFNGYGQHQEDIVCKIVGNFEIKKVTKKRISENKNNQG